MKQSEIIFVSPTRPFFAFSAVPAFFFSSIETLILGKRGAKKYGALRCIFLFNLNQNIKRFLTRIIQGVRRQLRCKTLALVIKKRELN
ncbi:hypothetical protein BpHYR1_001169 [Brachionus plicatilis]|uniref:Uncharacterized protein n=1 Tax=Brachionus plicatilis TaxID=10195 RepID=A0A3M7RIU1_BRAPC|nr:hypothetical protein BpHYR1_001169 [Brachionus plicatilis]